MNSNVGSYLIFVESVKGAERVWILGDEFAYKYYHQYYKENKHEGKHMTYLFEHFEVKDLLSTRYSNDRNVLSRLRNSLITALNQYYPVPRLIAVVMDDDITRYIDSRDKEDLVLTVEIGTIVEWITREFERAILSFKDYLPDKAKKAFYPHILWIAPPTHKFFGNSSNNKREKISNCLSTVVKYRQNMSVLRMIKIWDHDDSNAFVKESYRFTSEGLAKYWLSIDSAIRYWNVAVFSKFGVKQNVKTQVPSKNKYKWKKPSFNKQVTGPFSKY